MFYMFFRGKKSEVVYEYLSIYLLRVPFKFKFLVSYLFSLRGESKFLGIFSTTVSTTEVIHYDFVDTL